MLSKLEKHIQKKQPKRGPLLNKYITAPDPPIIRRCKNILNFDSDEEYIEPEITQKQLKKLELIEHKEKIRAAANKKIRYDNLKYPLFCPFCSTMTALNKINIHFKTKRCNKLKNIKLKNNDKLKENIIYIKIDTLTKILNRYDKDDKQIIDIINKIMNDPEPPAIDIENLLEDENKIEDDIY